MRSGIYFILNKISLKLYIGSAVYLVKRRSEHFTRLFKNIHHNEHLQRAYNKYGPDAFDFIVVELVELDKLIKRETYYIAKHRATEEEFGYNKCEVGSGMTGRKHSANTINKMRFSHLKKKNSPEEVLEKIKREGRKRYEPPKPRKPHTEQHKAKIKAGMKKVFSGINGDKHRDRMSDTANVRWNNEPSKRFNFDLTQAPIIVSNKKEIII